MLHLQREMVRDRLVAALFYEVVPAASSRAAMCVLRLQQVRPVGALLSVQAEQISVLPDPWWWPVVTPCRALVVR